MKEDYKIIKEVTPAFPIRELLEVPHQGKKLIVSYPAFGHHISDDTLNPKINKTYIHPVERTPMYFREPTTAESISIVNGAHSIVEIEMLNPSYLQIGRHLRTPEGVWSNPPKDKDGNVIIDEKVLKRHLDNAKKINGIYVLPNNTIEGVMDSVFAPYESFKQEKQTPEEFAVNPKTNGLARALEFSHNKKAPKLEEISKKYEEVYTWNLSSVSEPVIGVSGLNINDNRRLYVSGYCLTNTSNAFGVQK